MKWFFWFAIFWMLPCISDGPDVTCSGPVMIVKIRTPSPCGSCASEALRPSGGEGRRVPPPPLPACLRYTNLQFLWSHAGDSTCVCVCKSVGRVCECERQSPCTLFFPFHLNLLLLLCLSTSNLAARDLRGRRCALCFWREEEGEWGWSGWWRDERGQVRRRAGVPLSSFPLLLLSLSCSRFLSLSLSVTWCVCVFAVCVSEREWNRSAMLQQTGLWTCTGGSSPFQIEVCHWIVITRISTIPAPRGEICDWVKDGMLKAVETDSRGSVFSHQITHYVNVSTLKDKDVWE